MLEWSRVTVTRVPGWAAEILAMLCASLGFPTPSCQGDSQISRLNQGMEILDAWDVRMSKFLSNLSLVPHLLPLALSLLHYKRSMGSIIIGCILRAGALD